jgi:acetolactate synthase small subunit
MWFGEDRRANIIKTHVEKRLDYIFQILVSTLHSIVDITGVNYVSNYEINEHALLMIITMTNQERFECQSGFCRCYVIDFLMQHGFLGGLSNFTQIFEARVL